MDFSSLGVESAEAKSRMLKKGDKKKGKGKAAS